MAEVLVTGGTGVLGRAVVPALEAAWHGVRVLSRRPAPDAPRGTVTWAQWPARTGGVDEYPAG